MQRDMDLVRGILLAIEARPANSSNYNVDIPGRSREEIDLHLRLLRDAGLVEGLSFSSGPPTCTRLTWGGYEFLDSMRKDSLWEKAKEITRKETGGLALSVLIEVAKAVALKAATGII